MDDELQLRSQNKGKPVVELDTDGLRGEARNQANHEGYEVSCSVRELIKNPFNITLLDAGFITSMTEYREMSVNQLPLEEGPAVNIRNKAWVQTLAPILLKKSASITVGVGHLAGEDGLIQILRRTGFEVRPYNFKSIVPQTLARNVQLSWQFEPPGERGPRWRPSSIGPVLQ